MKGASDSESKIDLVKFTLVQSNGKLCNAKFRVKFLTFYLEKPASECCADPDHRIMIVRGSGLLVSWPSESASSILRIESRCPQPEGTGINWS